MSSSSSSKNYSTMNYKEKMEFRKFLDTKDFKDLDKFYDNVLVTSKTGNLILQKGHHFHDSYCIYVIYNYELVVPEVYPRLISDISRDIKNAIVVKLKKIEDFRSEYHPVTARSNKKNFNKKQVIDDDDDLNKDINDISAHELHVMAKLSLFLYTSEYYGGDKSEFEIVLQNLDFTKFEKKDGFQLSVFLKLIKVGNQNALIRLIGELLSRRIEIDGGTILKIYYELIRLHGKDHYFKNELFDLLSLEVFTKKIVDKVDFIVNYIDRYIKKHSYREPQLRYIKEKLFETVGRFEMKKKYSKK